MSEYAIRRCGEGELDAMLAIINEAAEAYRGTIPPNCWHEPYMTREALQSEIGAGVQFWGCVEGDADDRGLAGVMGLQEVEDVMLIRHAYVRREWQRRGVGGAMLSHLRAMSRQPVLIGTWADAEWAIRFYERHGFCMVGAAEKDRLLRRYWSVPERQMEGSVVLVDKSGQETVRR